MDQKLAELIKEAEAIKSELNRLNSRFSTLTDKITALSPDTLMPSVDKKINQKEASKKSGDARLSISSAENITKAMQIGRKKYKLSDLLSALRLNNLNVIEDLRNSLAKIAGQQNEKQVLSELISAGIPGVILTGTLKTAVIDASNIAQMAKSAKGKLSYLENTRNLAYKNGYFPVIMIADASLRHHIDRPSDFMDMVESGEIIMAPPYTSADELIIAEALRHDAVVLTNDRFNDWADAKKISKRHVVIHGQTLSLGDFHRSASAFWFR